MLAKKGTGSMSAVLTLLLFGTSLAASAWTLYVSIRPQLHRYRALFSPAPVAAQLPLRATRITVRWTTPARTQAPALRAAA